MASTQHYDHEFTPFDDYQAKNAYCRRIKDWLEVGWVQAPGRGGGVAIVLLPSQDGEAMSSISFAA